MKLTVKLSKDEAIGYKNFKAVVNEFSELSDDDFARFIFLKGVDAIQTEAQERAQKYIDDNPDEAKKLYDDCKKKALKDGTLDPSSITALL